MIPWVVARELRATLLDYLRGKMRNRDNDRDTACDMGKTKASEDFALVVGEQELL